MDEMNYWEEVQKNMHPEDYDAKGRRKKISIQIISGSLADCLGKEE